MSTNFPSDSELLEPGFKRFSQPKLIDDGTPTLQYVIKLHDATTLHYDFRLEIFGTLFSLVLYEPPSMNPNVELPAKRVGDHDLKHLLGERRIPAGQYGAGPLLVWDHGCYRPLHKTHACDNESVYEQLLNGQLDFQLEGCRYHCAFRLQRNTNGWHLSKLCDGQESYRPQQWDMLSVKSGRSLEEVDSNKRAVLWIEWDGFYSDHQSELPQVVMRDQIVLDANLPARRMRIEVGMGRAMVRTLAPECAITQWKPGQYKEKSEAWLDICTEFSGVVEPIDDHVAAIDLSKHPNPSQTAAELIAKLRYHLPYPLFTGLGPSKWLANLAATKGDLCHALKNPATFIAPFSIYDLHPLDPTICERLAALGYDKIGHVAALPPHVLRGQFDEASTLIMLAATGKLSDPVRALYPHNEVQDALYFQGAVEDSQVLEASLVTLGFQLSRKLKGRQSSHLVMTIHYESQPKQIVERFFTRPIYNAQTLVASLRGAWAQTDVLPCVTGIQATLKELAPVQTVQRSFFVARSSAEVGHTLQSLNQAIGEDKVQLASDVQIPHRNRVLKEWRDTTGWH